MELVDRYTIAQVKHSRTGGANQAELDFYEQQMNSIDKILIWDELQAFRILHDKIWSLEDDFKKAYTFSSSDKTTTAEQIMLHVFNHATYHRGQLITMGIVNLMGNGGLVD